MIHKYILTVDGTRNTRAVTRTKSSGESRRATWRTRVEIERFKFSVKWMVHLKTFFLRAFKKFSFVRNR